LETQIIKFERTTNTPGKDTRVFGLFQELIIRLIPLLELARPGFTTEFARVEVEATERLAELKNAYRGTGAFHGGVVFFDNIFVHSNMVKQQALLNSSKWTAN
jgi:hypothetical protein